MKEHAAIGFIGVIGGVVAAALQVLVTFMAIDYITGILVAAVFNKSKKSKSGAMESSSAFKGLIKKGVMLLIVVIGASLDNLINVYFVRYMVIISVTVIELTSIIENLELMGIPIHKVPALKKAIGILKERGEIDGGTE